MIRYVDFLFSYPVPYCRHPVPPSRTFDWLANRGASPSGKLIPSLFQYHLLSIDDAAPLPSRRYRQPHNQLANRDASRSGMLISGFRTPVPYCRHLIPPSCGHH